MKGGFSQPFGEDVLSPFIILNSPQIHPKTTKLLYVITINKVSNILHPINRLSGLGMLMLFGILEYETHDVGLASEKQSCSGSRRPPAQSSQFYGRPRRV